MAKKVIKVPKCVLNEARSLKKLITPEERYRLNIDNLDTQSASQCIYGQLTGNCHSERAVELIKASCSRVYHAPKGSHPRTSTKMNGSPKKTPREVAGYYKYWSPIEVWIDRDIPGFNKQLVAYLKGEKRVLR
jgi:hypothetical protein